VAADGGEELIRLPAHVLDEGGEVPGLWLRLRLGPPIVEGADHTLDVLGERIEPAEAAVVQEVRVPHDNGRLAEELRRLASSEAELVIVFGASAIADRRDVIPAALEAAGGTVEHFGMPVDPGNLLLTGELDGKPVLGLPGCAKSPKYNGFDTTTSDGVRSTSAPDTRQPPPLDAADEKLQNLHNSDVTWAGRTMWYPLWCTMDGSYARQGMKRPSPAYGTARNARVAGLTTKMVAL
jgi:hypothetical protein